MAAPNLNTTQLSKLTDGEKAEVNFLASETSDGTYTTASYVNYETNLTNAAVLAKNPRATPIVAAESTFGPGAKINVAFFNDATLNFSTAEINDAWNALQLWSGLVNVSFLANAAKPMVGFFHSGDPTIATSPAHGATTAYTATNSTTPVNNKDTTLTGTIEVDPTGGHGDIASTTNYAGYGIDVLVHEIGHMMGLGHSGPYNGALDVTTQQLGDYDSRTWSIMSYINPDTNNFAVDANLNVLQDAAGHNILATPEYAAGYTVNSTFGQDASGFEYSPWTPMGLDLFAAQRLMGAPTSRMFAGSNTFGFNSNITGVGPDGKTPVSIMAYDFTVNTHPIVTLYDYGTNNTLDLSGFTLGSRVDLNDGVFSDTNGMANNLFIEWGTQIDAAVGGAGDDSFTLNGRSDKVDGKGGHNLAILPNARADYVVGVGAANEIVLTSRSTGVVDDLTNIAQVQFACSSAAVTVTDLVRDVSWVGGAAANGNHFGIAGNWSNNQVPGSASEVTIGAGSSVVVTQQEQNEVDSLTLAAGASIEVSSGIFVIDDVAASSNNAGVITVDNQAHLYVGHTLVDTGTILLGSDGGSGELTTYTAAVTLAGTGFLRFQGGGQIDGRAPTGAAPYDTLTNDIGITGFGGTIGRGGFGYSLNFVNNNLVEATEGPSALVIAAPTVNNAQLTALHGTLDITGTVNQSSGGAIVSSGASSTVLLDGGTITGGLIDSVDGGVIRITRDTVLNGVTVIGTVTLDAGVTLTIAGDVDTRLATIDASAGSINTSGGTLHGGTVKLPTATGGAGTGSSGNLVLDGGTDGLTLSASKLGFFYFGLQLSGLINHAGTISLQPYETAIVGTARFGGGGTFTFGDNSAAAGNGHQFIDGGGTNGDPVATGAVLDNIDNIFVGYGIIGYGNSALINEGAGTFIAKGGRMVLNPIQAAAANGTTSGLVNQGLLEAVAGGTLEIDGAVDGTGGTILNAGGTVTLAGAVVAGGTLSGAIGTTGISGLGATGAQATTVAGTLTVQGGGTLRLSGAIAVTGTLTEASPVSGSSSGIAQGTELLVATDTSLSGGGTLLLNDTELHGAAGATLHNLDVLVTGHGTIGAGHGYAYGSGTAQSLSLVNEAGGRILAQSGALTFTATNGIDRNGAGYNDQSGTLEIDTGTAVLANKGGIGARGGTLIIASTIDGTGGGTISASSVGGVTGTVQLAGGTIRGGTLMTDPTDGSAAIRVAGSDSLDNSVGEGQGQYGGLSGGTLDGTAGAVSITAGSQVLAYEGAQLSITGAIANAGALRVHGTQGYQRSALVVVNGATLTGGGVVDLAGSTPYAGQTVETITGKTAQATLTNVDNTVAGAGLVGNGMLTVVNQSGGVFSATQAPATFDFGNGPTVVSQNAMVINTGTTGGRFVNAGLVMAQGGTLDLMSKLENVGGTLAARGGGQVLLDGGTVAGGTIAVDAGSTFGLKTTGGSLDGTAGAVAITAGSLLAVSSSTTLTLSGAIANAGTIGVTGTTGSSSVYVATVRVAGTATLSGGGKVVLDDNAYVPGGKAAVVRGTSTADMLDNVNELIVGTGQLGGGKMSFTNEAAGIVAATTGTLTIDTGTATVVNNGLMEAGGGNLVVNSAISNGGLIEAQNGVVTLNGLLSGGNLKVDATGQLRLAGGVSGGTNLSFSGNGGSVVVVPTATAQPFATVVHGFNNTDTLDLAGVQATSSYANSVVTLRNAANQVIGTVTVADATASDAYSTASDGNGGTKLVRQTVVPAQDIKISDVTTGTNSTDVSTDYAGPVSYLQHQYIWTGTDSVAISAALPNTFLKGGPGGDALLAKGGNNVLDGGGGSNFLIGADGSDGGADVFFVDSRDAVETWSTIVNFHQGDLATIFGFHDGLSTRPYTDSDGADGYKGLTIHSEINGAGTGVKGSMTFAGIDRATADAHFVLTTGTLAGNIDYLLIQYQ